MFWNYFKKISNGYKYFKFEGEVLRKSKGIFNGK